MAAQFEAGRGLRRGRSAVAGKAGGTLQGVKTGKKTALVLSG
jgi:hypothetical protein